MTGSLKLIWAIFQALFIGFVQTLGSDFWLRLDSTARAQRLAMIEDITKTTYSEGMLTANWTSGFIAQPIALAVSHSMDTNTPYPQYNYIGVGCYRSSDWAWYFQGLDWRWTLPLVPLFAFLLALWNLQAMRVWKDGKHILIMVFFGCASYAGEYLRLHLFLFFSEAVLSTSQCSGRELYPWISWQCSGCICSQLSREYLHKTLEWLCFCCHGSRDFTFGANRSYSSRRISTELWL